MTHLKLISPNTFFNIMRWQSLNLTPGGGHYMTFEMLKYGLYVPDNAAFAFSFKYNLN